MSEKAWDRVAIVIGIIVTVSVISMAITLLGGLKDGITLDEMKARHVVALALFCIATLGIIGTLAAVDRSMQAAKEPSEEGEVGALFCPDCGHATVFMTTVLGYDKKTGKQRLSANRVCPDRYKGSPRPYLSSGNTVGCGATKGTVGFNHLDHPKDVPSAECPACVNSMIELGVIDPLDAVKMMKRAGIKV